MSILMGEEFTLCQRARLRQRSHENLTPSAYYQNRQRRAGKTSAKGRAGRKAGFLLPAAHGIGRTAGQRKTTTAAKLALL
jgi:hypothetical protein